jgi:hypothetical protein
MSRAIDDTTKAATEAQVVIPVIICRLDYASGAVTINTATFPIIFEDETYYGVGNFGTTDTVKQSSELQDSSINLSLSGIDSSLVSQALGDESYQGRDCKIWIAFLNSDDYSIIGTPVLYFRGKMNNSSITFDEKQAIITLNVVGRSSSLYRPKIRRYNTADQKKLYPNDTGLDYVEQSVNKEISWGSRNATS